MNVAHYNPDIFRAYDIRGVADRDLHDEFAVALGRAFATWIRRKRGAVRIVVGRDCRLTSERIATSLLQGLMDSGADVIDIGTVPSPVVYFAAHHFQSDGAIVITGSHNPAPDNGFKMMMGTAAVHSAAISEIRDIIDSARFTTGHGTMQEQNIAEPYLAHATAALRLGGRKIRVVVDGGHGAGGPLAAELYTRLGFDVIPLYCEMDGSFPAHHPDPTEESNLVDLQQEVKRSEADLGLALDGDGDRLGAVDGRGRILWGDQLMLLFGLAILQEKRPARFIAEVKCSQTLFDGLTEAGGEILMWKVGHSLIKDKMKEIGADLAGEMSGHLFFADRYLGFDDAIYAGARLLELLSHGGNSLADLRDRLPEMVATPEIRIPCADAKKFALVEEVKATLRNDEDVIELIDIDGVRARFADGWGLVRASNTQAVLVVRIEAGTEDSLLAIRERIESVITKAESKL